MIKSWWVKFRNIKIVKFSNDKYGIRKGWLIYRFNTGCNEFPWCWRTDREVLKRNFNKIAKIYESRFVDEGEIVSYTRTNDDK